MSERRLPDTVWFPGLSLGVVMLVTTAAANGQRLGFGTGSRRSGCASMTVVATTSLRSARRPVTVICSSPSQRGVREPT